MTPLELQSALKKHVEKVVDGMLLSSAEGDKKAILVFEQHLPTKAKSNSRNPENTFYPCIIVYLDEGDNPGESTAEQVKVYFVIGVYDDDEDNQGYRDAMIINQRIIQSLVKNPIIENRFEFKDNYKWKYDDEDRGPYHYVLIESYFEIPRSLREDVEGMI